MVTRTSKLTKRIARWPIMKSWVTSRTVEGHAAWTYIKDDQIKEEHEDVDDNSSNALQLAHDGLGVLKRECQMLPLLHTPPACSA